MHNQFFRIFSQVLVKNLTTANPNNPFNPNPNKKSSFVFKQVTGESEKGKFIGFNVKSINKDNDGYIITIEEQPFKQGQHIYLLSIWRGNNSLTNKVYEFRNGYMLSQKDYKNREKLSVLANLLYSDISDFIEEHINADNKLLNEEVFQFIQFVKKGQC